MKKLITCFACLALITAGALYPQQGKGKIRGIVTDAETGQPLPGVTVKMFMPNLNVFFQPSPVTDNEGKWGANFLRTGLWTLDFDKVGYAPQTVSWDVAFDASARVAAQREVVTVALRPIKGLIIKDTIIAGTQKADKLYQEKKYVESRALLEKLIADNPDAYIIYKNIGNTYFAEENYEKAIEAYKMVYAKAPDRADVVAAIANSYNNLGNKTEAASWYGKLTVGDVKDIDTAYNAGVCLYNAGSTAEAIQYFKKAVEIDPSFADGYYQLGMASVAQGQNDVALDAFKKFLELAPDSPQAATAKSIMEALTKK